MTSSSDNLTMMTTSLLTIKSKEKDSRLIIIKEAYEIKPDFSNNINTNISNTFENEENKTPVTNINKPFLDLKQKQLTQDFLKKHADNNNLYIFPNKYEPEGKKIFILLNLTQDKESFQDFVTNNYKVALSNQYGVMDFNNFKVYYTNTLQSVHQILDEVTSVFINSGFTVVKMQLIFNIIWESPTIEAGNMELISEYT
jgi:phenylalanyl-tRNA synthetase alpha subunit